MQAWNTGGAGSTPTNPLGLMTHAWWHGLPRGTGDGDLLHCLAAIHVGSGHTTAAGTMTTASGDSGDGEGDARRGEGPGSVVARVTWIHRCMEGAS